MANKRDAKGRWLPGVGGHTSARASVTKKWLSQVRIKDVEACYKLCLKNALAGDWKWMKLYLSTILQPPAHGLQLEVKEPETKNPEEIRKLFQSQFLDHKKKYPK